MYRSVMVPLDGSTSAELALPVAHGIAQRTGGEVHLVHVHVPLLRAEAGASAPPIYGGWESEAKDQEEAYLAGVRGRLGAQARIRIDHRLEEGSVVETLVQSAVETGAELIVMTTHGRGPLARAWLGSVADGVVRRSPVPVLLLRPSADAEPMGERLFRSILVTLDGSELAERVLGPASALGALSQARYTLLRVVSPLLVTGYAPAPEGVLSELSHGPELDMLIADAETYLGRVAAPLRARGLEVETQVVVELQPAVGILDFAREQAADLIAMATHGRRGLRRLMLGSVADKVLRGTTAAVLLLRPES